jgi:ABC-type xylose transport system substrate-binding protein
MAKAILKYDISDLEDSQDFKRAVKSFDMAMALWDIIQLRKKMENRFEAQDNTNNDVFDGIDAMAEGIVSILDQHGIIVDELIG